jgi:NAD(P)-dependent dehydrogenase (short-subunit alcohol dehydrogenase family)
LAAAKVFARAGFFTYAAVRTLESVGARELEEWGVGNSLLLHVIKMDVTDEVNVREAAREIGQEVGRVDVLINNAGFGYFGPVEEFAIEEIKSQYEVNVFGAVRVTQAVLPLMRPQESGLIINISSISGLMSLPFSGVYASSKYALEALSDALRLEVAPFGIKVVLVEPGSFVTAFTANARFAAAFQKRSSPYGRILSRVSEKFAGGQIKRKPFSPLRPASAEKVAALLLKIAQTRNPQARYLIGRDAHFFLWLKRLLPSFLWDAALRRFYGW